jgi:hypothetical protein
MSGLPIAILGSFVVGMLAAWAMRLPRPWAVSLLGSFSAGLALCVLLGAIGQLSLWAAFGLGPLAVFAGYALGAVVAGEDFNRETEIPRKERFSRPADRWPW